MDCENPQRQEQGSQAVGIPWGNTLNSSAVIALPVWKCLVYYLVGIAQHKSKRKLTKVT